MKIDHIGYAVKSIDKAKKQMEVLGFENVTGEIKEVGDRKDYTTPVDTLPAITDVFLKVLAGDWE